VTFTGKSVRSSSMVEGAGMIHRATLSCVGQSHARPRQRTIGAAWLLHTAHWVLIALAVIGADTTTALTTPSRA